MLNNLDAKEADDGYSSEPECKQIHEIAPNIKFQDLSTPIDAEDSLVPATTFELDNISYTNDEEIWIKGLIDAIDPHQTVSSSLIIDWLEQNQWTVPEAHPILTIIKKESEQ